MIPTELLDDRCQSGAAFEGELDLDRDPLVAGEDGVGQVRAAGGARGPGLRERAFALGGDLRVEPGPRGGVRVLARLPLHKVPVHERS